MLAASLLLAAASALFVPSSAGAAEPYDAPTKAALQEVIAGQLKAFEKDDAKTAESFAAPAIKERFPEPSQFLDMVKRSYSPLVHPKSTHFDGAGNSGLGPMETVTIVDSTGVAWTAVYTFEQVDGQWRITGCSLLKSPDTSV